MKKAKKTNRPVAGKQLSELTRSFGTTASLQTVAMPPNYRTRGDYKTLTIEGFRAFAKLALTDLSSINIFFGQNNSGKSSVLEAVYTHAAGLNLGPFISQVLVRRSSNFLMGALDAGEKLRSLFRDHSSLPYQFKITASLAASSHPWELNVSYRPSPELADLDPRTLGQAVSSPSDLLPPTYGGLYQSPTVSGGLYTDFGIPGNSQAKSPGQLRPVPLGRWTTRMGADKQDIDLTFPLLTANEEPFKLASFCDILTHRSPDTDLRLFSHLKRYGEMQEFTQELETSFPNVSGIDMFPYPDGAMSPIYIKTKDDRWIPSFAFGDGMRRWYFILGQMMVFRNGTHCIEEIDATFHPAAYPTFSKALLKYVRRFQCQLFLTTHNIEFTDAFLSALYGEDGVVTENETDPVRLYTLTPGPDVAHPEVWPLSGREAYEKRKKYELELR